MTDTIHELKITLCGSSKPPIWRKVAVPSGITLGGLHEVIQIAMGWSNSHLHQFILRRERYFIGRSPYGGDEDMEGEDENGVTLAEVCPAPKSKITYEYDFGDGWEHDVVVQEVYAPKDGVEYPVCLAVKGACPVEDCGGIGGYYHLLKVLADPKHAEHEDMVEWTGGPIDPEEFDLDGVNQALASLRPKRRGKAKKPKARKVWMRRDEPK